jgi:predicted nuclease of predicted toxin-antitoxin system
MRHPRPHPRRGVKFKLDENLSRRAADLIRIAGHDAVTVVSQGLRGVADEALFQVCKCEGRALVTLDHDFGQVLRYPPATTAGIVVLETGPRATHAALLDRVRELVILLNTRSPEDALWIVEPGRLRIHLPSGEEAQ